MDFSQLSHPYVCIDKEYNEFFYKHLHHAWECGVSTKRKAEYCRKVGLGICYLHQQGFYHTNITPFTIGLTYAPHCTRRKHSGCMGILCPEFEDNFIPQLRDFDHVTCFSQYQQVDIAQYIVLVLFMCQDTRSFSQDTHSYGQVVKGYNQQPQLYIYRSRLDPSLKHILMNCQTIGDIIDNWP